MNDQPAHPALVRLRAELVAARSGLGVLGELEGSRRDRVLADLLTSVSDAASRAARVAGAEVVVAEVQRFASVDGAASGPGGAPAVWDDIAQAAIEAATAVHAQA
ncbi:hypothetical protein [Curtobacterium sp. MCBA15_012]|uniref:hypothetical protein n=1 Tax=Curtobacterium sp. MCBA15_012 TaxID=1898738 RepID=UPI0008DDCE3D|nr:hypothetical protein [Curtobacterium sp. MCBA15_012]WIB01155.1 hypothetical protein QOL15_05550 [Curtobacterium sp. MCBA15_012]